ncbi:tRNA (adenosine(37)-N6)-threonylcarbamoyltransferase complex ATPase subunit type 1 TsaE [Halovulum sp. GXIMD14793]
MSRIHFADMTEAGVHRLADQLASHLRPGDTLLLSGPVGAGKSVFARALIRAWLGDSGAEVPSPSYTLVQTYERGDQTLWHVDLYRLDPQGTEVDELGLDEAFTNAVCLIEWPERLGTALPSQHLSLSLSPHTDTADRRAVTLTATAGLTHLIAAASQTKVPE